LRVNRRGSRNCLGHFKETGGGVVHNHEIDIRRVASSWADYDVIVAGAGLFGLVVAERVASVLGRKVCVLERRDHIGGNCYSEADARFGDRVSPLRFAPVPHQ